MPPPDSLPPSPLARILAWRRLRVLLLWAIPLGLLMSIGTPTSAGAWIARSLLVGLAALIAFGVTERWPAQPPARTARWGLQLLAVVGAVPVAACLAYWVTTGDARWFHDAARVNGFVKLAFTGILVAPWVALAAMVRQREIVVVEQARAFALERSELQREALDARLSLMQAQVQPHFLFNTLANVRALVRSGSPQAEAVLDSLIAYLRAAVPRIDRTSTTMAGEADLARSYLELMHMRFPDRLQFTLHVDDDALAARCPPMTLLTLVENAVRHGIDPSESGGRIEVGVSVRAGRCIARVLDTGVGLQGDESRGTGLSSLRERLRLAFGGDVRLSLSRVVPHGTSAEVEFPFQPEAT